MKKIIVGIFLFSIFFLWVHADVAVFDCTKDDDECLKNCRTQWGPIACEVSCCGNSFSSPRTWYLPDHEGEFFSKNLYISALWWVLFLVFLSVLFYRHKKLTSKKEKNDE